MSGPTLVFRCNYCCYQFVTIYFHQMPFIEMVSHSHSFSRKLVVKEETRLEIEQKEERNFKSRFPSGSLTLSRLQARHKFQ